MYVLSNSPKYTCPKCRNKVAVGDLEDIFHEQLRAFLFSPEEVTNYLKLASDVIREKEELLNAQIAEEDKVRAEMSKLYKLYMDGGLTSKRFAQYNRPLEERLAQMDEGIPELEAEIDFLKIQHLSSDQILHEARDLYTRWPDLTTEEKRGIVEHITEQITTTGDEVTITLAYLPSRTELIAKEQTTHQETQFPGGFQGQRPW